MCSRLGGASRLTVRVAPCIVIDNDVNIAAKQCFSCTNALCYISTASSYQKLHEYSARESQ